MITKLGKLATSGLRPAAIHQFCRSASTTKLFINGEFRDSKSNDWIDIHNPVSGHFRSAKLIRSEIIDLLFQQNMPGNE